MNPIYTSIGSSTPQIACPTCKTGGLILGPANSNVHCTDCDASFPIRNGIIDLLPESQQALAAAWMEWEWTGRFYESRWWRRNPLVAAFILGISFDKELELIMRAANLKGDETLLDLACGPGIYTRPFAKRLHRGTVVGLDLSFSMLNYASKQAQSEGINNLLFIHGDALELPFPDNEFDVVNCCGALHLFPYLEVLQNIRRILKPGGCFTVAVVRHVEEAGSLSRLREYLWRKSGVYPFPEDELGSLLTEAGLTDITRHHAKCYWQIISAVKPH